MRKRRFTEEQMVKILREADQFPVAEVAKKHGVSDVTIYAWRKRFGKLEPADVKRLRQLAQANAKLKKLLAERDLEIEVMKKVAAAQEIGGAASIGPRRVRGRKVVAAHACASQGRAKSATVPWVDRKARGVAHEARRVREAQRIILHVGISIPPLRMAGTVDERIGRDEARRPRVIHPAVHVHEVKIIEHFVAGKALPRGVVDFSPVRARRLAGPAVLAAARAELLNDSRTSTAPDALEMESTRPR